MKKVLILLFALLFFLTLGYAGNIDFSGRVKLFTSLFLSQNKNGKYFTHETGEFAFKRLETRLKLAGYVTDNVSYGVRLDAFSRPDAIFNQVSFPEASILGTPSATEPFELSLYEGYIKITNFLIENLDLTIGKQRIQWGTADKMNVVDNLNPVDFANFFTFDPDYFAERRPQNAINLEYYISDFTKIQLIWLLSRQYAPLPSGFTYMLMKNYNLPVYIESEKLLLRNTNYGLRFSTVFLNTDVGLSYYSGNYHLPVLYKISQSPYWTPSQYYKYPEKDIFGIDLSGEIHSIGWWAEFSYIKPEKIKGHLETQILIGKKYLPVKKEFPVFEKGYYKWVIGADYTIGIGNGIYLNAQYLHGFFDERDYSVLYEKYLGFKKGMFFGEIEDYLITRAEYKMLEDNLKIELGGIMEFAKKNAFSFIPSIEYRFSDAVIFQMGAFIVFGDEENTKFGVFKKDKLLYMLFKVDF
ncbi:hypothetical protein NLB65_01820 [Candidatus Aminicenantes bacterium AC-335-B20]|jgi:hypothetical protein|nr:hypothetical protein [SCandidatus Aminicenantes bacterium Aminicenantia_JdfR_composite]MCP2599175.1 hypothetical protein [Candidatus Aminicenantes bacterium AC-335-B20]MCP2620753.1 hypothetical protein [Candidatus Aminicenantes bacterium AC-334-E05]